MDSFFFFAVAVKAISEAAQITGILPVFDFFTHANDSADRFNRVHQS